MPKKGFLNELQRPICAQIFYHFSMERYEKKLDQRGYDIL